MPLPQPWPLLQHVPLDTTNSDCGSSERIDCETARMPGLLRQFRADTAYRGLKVWLQRALGWRLSIPQHWWTGGVWARIGAEPPTRPSGFQVLARRWVVERTIGWLTTNRRLAKDYERFVETGEMLLYLAMSRILLRRLTRKHER